MSLKLGTTNIPGVRVAASDGQSYTAGTGINIINDVISLDINAIYPVGSVYLNINNVNPSTFIIGTTWELISSVGLASENVFGNGKGLGATEGSHYSTFSSYGNNLIDEYAATIGSNVGSSVTGSGKLTSAKVVGVPTKTQLGANPENSGIIADTITLYTWKRTA